MIKFHREFHTMQLKTKNYKRMKTIKQLLLIILFAALSSIALSKENKIRPDSVHIRFENCLLEVSTFNIKKNTLEKADLKSKINELLLELEKIEIANPKEGEKIKIRWTGYFQGFEQEHKVLTMNASKKNKKSIIKTEGVLIEKDFGNILLEIEDKDYLIRLHVNKLEDAQIINSPEFTKRVKLADTEMPDSRKPTNAWLLENKNGSVNSYFLNTLAHGTQDMLVLSTGIGVGLIQNQLVSSIDFNLGLQFSKKGIYRNSYFANYELLYDFSNSADSKDFDINGFLSLGYERNFSHDPNKAKWYGLSLGYLVGKGNNFFEKNTFKIAIHNQIGNGITLVPEFYFNDFFKNFTPALKVKISLFY